MTIRTDKQIGKYLIKELVGRGGMAEVYKAFQPGLDRDVAIKIIHPHLVETAEAVERFQREAKLIATLRHPGIVQVYDFDIEDNIFYMVMEYVPGESLHRWTFRLQRRNERVPLEELLPLFRSIIEAVAYAHSQGIIHQDIKPANVLLTGEKQPILSDFGLSKIITPDDSFTPAGIIAGTPHYMSPEQCAGDVIDARSDIYSLGVMLYQLTTGTLPFDDPSLVGIILKHMNEPFTPPRSVNPDLPIPLEQVITRTLAKHPDERYASAQELLTALEALLAPAPSSSNNTFSLNRPSLATPDAGRCPYRGLQTFEAEHAEFYFGREALVDQLVKTLTGLARPRSAMPTVEILKRGVGRLVAVLGASGSGKSSLARAGVLPALPASSDKVWVPLIMKPGAHPLEELAARLVPVLDGDESQAAPTLAELSANLSSDGRALHLAVGRAWLQESPERYLLLVVDQFEEIFTLCQDEPERERFIENLLYAASIGEGRVVILLTMRADFYHHCAAHRDLATRISARQALVGAMNEAELRRAIERPAQQVGLQFEPGLVETILADVAQQPGALPLLQHALLELWERRAHGLLTLPAYRAIGGVAGAVAQRAESVYAEFNPAEKTIVRRVMVRLTQPGQGAADTRRRVLKRELLPGPEEKDQAGRVEAVIQRLTDARLTTTTLDTAGGEEVVEVVHEALIRGWTRLRDWLDEDRAALRTHRRLTEAAHEWDRNHRDESYLFRGAHLAELELWAERYGPEMNALERSFLEASIAKREQEAAEREARRRQELVAAQALAQERTRSAAALRRRARWLTGVGAAALLLAVAAFVLAGRANSAQRTATRQKSIVFAQYLAAQAEANLEDWPQRSLLLAREAVRATDEEPAPGAVQTLLQILAAAGGRPLPGHPMALPEDAVVRRVKFSPEGTLLATAAEVAGAGPETTCAAGNKAGLIRLWQIGDLETLPVELAVDCPILALAFSPEMAGRPDQRWLVTGEADGAVRLWNVTDPAAPPLTLSLFGDGVAAAAFSLDGQWFAAGSLSEVRLWRVGEMLDDPAAAVPLLLEEPTMRFVGSRDNKFLKFSPDGRWLAVAHRLWALNTPQVDSAPSIVLPLYDGPEFAQAVAFSPDGQYLAAARQNDVIVWEMAGLTSEATPLKQLHASEGKIWDVAFSPDSSHLAAGGEDQTARLWRLAGLTDPPLTLSGHSDTIWQIRFSPGGDWLATASDDRTVRLWSVADPTAPPRVLRGHEGRIEDLSFSPDNRRLATAGDDGVARLWTTASPSTEPLVYADYKNALRMTATDPASDRLATGDETGKIWLWPLGSGDSILEPVAFVQDSPVSAGAFSASAALSQQWLVTGAEDGRVRLWDLDGPLAAPQATFGEGGVVRALAASANPNQPWLATEHSDQQTRLWNLDEAAAASNEPVAPVMILGKAGRPALPVVFSPDGQWLVASGYDPRTNEWDNHFQLWRIAASPVTATQVLTIAYEAGLSAAAFSRDSRWLVIGTWDQTAHLWDLTDPATVRRPIDLLSGETEHVITTAAFDHDNHWLAAGGLDGTGQLWDLTTLSTEAISLTASISLAGLTDRMTRLVFSSDDHWLAAGGQDGTIRLWDLTAPDPATASIALPGPAPVEAIGFNTTQNFLIAGHRNNTIRLWHLHADKLVELACTVAGRNLTKQEQRQFFGEQAYRNSCPK